MLPMNQIIGIHYGLGLILCFIFSFGQFQKNLAEHDL
jgi:hypothetical protein